MAGDPASVLGQKLTDRIISWLEERKRLNEMEDQGDYPHADEWHASDDYAADIVHSIAYLFNITIEEVRDES